MLNLKQEVALEWNGMKNKKVLKLIRVCRTRICFFLGCNSFKKYVYMGDPFGVWKRVNHLL